jgi:hypothetical protein
LEDVKGGDKRHGSYMGMIKYGKESISRKENGMTDSYRA